MFVDKKDALLLKGKMSARLTHEDGSFEDFEKDNIIVTVGYDYICNVIGLASQPAAMGYIAVGTGVTAPASADTALQTELVRQAATYAHTAGTKVFTLSTTFAAGVGTGALTESGVFNASSAGVMFDHVTFSVINKAASDTLTQTFTFTLS